MQVKIAQSRGAVGVIIYSDPKDYLVNEDGDVYPNSWWLPGTGVQRGTIFTGPDGDPLTPGYPSTSLSFISKYSVAFCNITVLFLSYFDKLKH